MKYWCKNCNSVFDSLDKNSYYEYVCPYCDSKSYTTKISLGAPVQLTNGTGPLMTVEEINNNIATCIFFDEQNELKKVKLATHSLTFMLKENICDNEEDIDDDDDDYYDDDDY